MDRLWQVSINSYWPLSATWPFELPADATCTPPLSPTKWPPSATWTPLSPPKRPLSACCFQHGPPNRPPSACYHWCYSRRHIRETSTRDQVRFSKSILHLNPQRGQGDQGDKNLRSGQTLYKHLISETEERLERSKRSELEIRSDSP